MIISVYCLFLGQLKFKGAFYLMSVTLGIYRFAIIIYILRIQLELLQFLIRKSDIDIYQARIRKNPASFHTLKTIARLFQLRTPFAFLLTACVLTQETSHTMLEVEYKKEVYQIQEISPISPTMLIPPMYYILKREYY